MTDTGLGRRDFLKSAVVGGAAAATTGTAVLPEAAQAQTRAKAIRAKATATASSDPQRAFMLSDLKGATRGSLLTGNPLVAGVPATVVYVGPKRENAVATAADDAAMPTPAKPRRKKAKDVAKDTADKPAATKPADKPKAAAAKPGDAKPAQAKITAAKPKAATQ